MDMEFAEIPVRAAAKSMAATLPNHHRDPFDRLLIAQSIMDSLTLFTSDPWFSRYGAAVTLIS